MINKAVFPIAGLGPSFLPATKPSDKGVLLVVDKPLIQYSVEEAYSAGIWEMIFVTGRTKRSEEEHFDTAYELETEMEVARDIAPENLLCTYSAKPLTVYGYGMQILDWLYAKDHCSGIRCLLEAGRLGETYNVGDWNEKPNIEIVHTVCALLDELRPKADDTTYASHHLLDRPPKARPQLRD